ncbi:hypothetical protein ACVIW2_003354 [Bradyrhizobium huanghuaihaiense]|uniref:Nif11 domain-containing protein n=1 Tax=Bradyrhizobium huanghuaihaiense TaxID=990078 RepID=A0A562R433_9BRAD|nr:MULTISPECIES: hypothetical protein [Bradyrhizobium]TWI63334.1 hypothetical protein IQ16_06393 [Bradyrhizobium huanghuaihaiense]UWU74791.1 hypothetical protein N2603_32780 [Bradyrhizobium sp. CB3035]
MKIDQWTKFLMSVAGDASAEAIIRSGDTRQIIGLAKMKGFEFTEMDIDDVRGGDVSGGLTDETLEEITGAMLVNGGKLMVR